MLMVLKSPLFARIAGLFLGICLAIPLTTSAADTARSGNASPFPIKGKTWTIAFYLAGESSLERQQLLNLKAIVSAAARANDCNIIVFFDRDDQRQGENPRSTWKGTRVFAVRSTIRDTLGNPLTIPLPHAIEEQRFQRSVLERLSREDDRKFVSGCFRQEGQRYWLRPLSGKDRQRLFFLLKSQCDYLLPVNGKAFTNLEATSARTLNQYMAFVRDNYISDHYALVVSGHGSGWFTPPDHDPVAPGRGHEFNRAISTDVLVGGLMDTPLDLLVLDSCFMGDAETAWALHRSTQYLVVSRSTLPATGLDFGRWLDQLFENKAPDPEQAAIAMIQSTAQAYAGTPYPISITALRMQDAFRDFMLEFQTCIGSAGRRGVLLSAAPNFRHSLSAAGRRQMVLFTDVLSVCDLDLRFQDEIVLARHTSRSEPSPLSIYLPAGETAYALHRSAYAQTSLARQFPQGWSAVLPELVASMAP